MTDSNKPVKPYRLTKDDLWRVLADWDTDLTQPLLLVACGGTALTLLEHKESTRDVEFQTDLLDGVHLPEHHRVVREFGRITVATLTPLDLIISKMFRGDLADVQDSIVIIQAEHVDLERLAKRYRETASYYHHPEHCRKTLGLLRI